MAGNGVNTVSGHHNAMFLVNSRIPLVRFSSELIVHYIRENLSNPIIAMTNPLVASQL